MTHNKNANMNRDALLQALSALDADELFSDMKLNELIEAEHSKPVELMDCEVLDACYQLLERRYSPFTDRKIARSERKGLKQLKRFMKQHRTSITNHSALQFKPLAAAVLVVIMIMAPALIMHKGFRVSMTPDKQQYLVVGIQQNDTGIARAMVDRNVEGKTVRLKSVDEIPSLLGYQIELPTWMPNGTLLSRIDITQNHQFDEVSLEFAENSKRIYIEATSFENRDGVGVSYEQDMKGKNLLLDNGASIYVASNEQAAWGLYQSSHLDYYIEAIGFDEDTICKLFDSVGGSREKK